MSLLTRLRRFPRRLSRKLGLCRVYGFPEELKLVPTNACNIRCRQCPKTWYKTDNQHLHPDIYERVKSELFDKVAIVNLQGLGEPMMAPLFPKMLDDAEARRLLVRFVTNCTFMTDQAIDQLARMGAELTISIDGACRQTHEASRPGGRFDNVIWVLEQLRARREAHPEAGGEVIINTVVTTRNIDELEGILGIAARVGAGRLNLISPGVAGRDDDWAEAAIGNHPSLLRERIPGLEARASELGVAFTYPPFAAPPAAGTASVQEPVAPAGRGSRLFPRKCFEPWDNVYIDVDGWVRPCCVAVWIGMGNIMTKPFREIWNNEHYLRLRRTINTDSPPGFCRACAASFGINGGDEHHVSRLEAAGIRLADPLPIGASAP